MIEPTFSTPHVTVYCGDALTVLRTLPSESVDTCVTSPPYWGLRSYATDGQVWGGERHEHEWTTASRPGMSGGTQANFQITPDTEHGFCSCGAWRGELGLEPTPELYVEHMVEVFREVRRVLRPAGTLWLVLGDSYASKQLVGVPWLVAFALQTDGWYLRSDIIWSKPNPMPESVTDRPTKAHEMIFLLSKSPRYYFDQEAVREEAQYAGVGLTKEERLRRNPELASGISPAAIQQHGWTAMMSNPAGRNIRSVWTIATQPYPDAHFATFPPELPERCIRAGCPEAVCATCGKARERITESRWDGRADSRTAYTDTSQKATNLSGSRQRYRELGMEGPRPPKVLGYTDCGHDAYRPGLVLDPFAGSGTTLAVARDLGRKSIGIELSPEYVKLIERRVAQLALI